MPAAVPRQSSARPSGSGSCRASCRARRSFTPRRRQAPVVPRPSLQSCTAAASSSSPPAAALRSVCGCCGRRDRRLRSAANGGRVLLPTCSLAPAACDDAAPLRLQRRRRATELGASAPPVASGGRTLSPARPLTVVPGIPLARFWSCSALPRSPSEEQTDAERAGEERKKGINAISQISPTQPNWK